MPTTSPTVILTTSPTTSPAASPTISPPTSPLANGLTDPPTTLPPTTTPTNPPTDPPTATPPSRPPTRRPAAAPTRAPTQPSPTANAGYVERGVGNCDGSCYIESLVDCALAAANLGMDDVTSNRDDVTGAVFEISSIFTIGNAYPLGCCRDPEPRRPIHP